MATRETAIRIPVDEQLLAGRLVTSGARVPGVLFVHGWGGSQQQFNTRAHKIAALGGVCLTFNLRGHVETQLLFESVSRETNLRDVVAAFDHLAAQPEVDMQAMAVVGSSYGGYLASILTTLRRVRWLALRAPALYIDEDWELPKLQLHKSQDLKSYRRGPIRAADNRALRACLEFRGDVLLIESEHDNIVPQAVLSSYREACVHAHSLTYRCIAGADHGLTNEADQRCYTTLLVNWLNEMAFESPSRARAAQAETTGQPSAPEVPPQTIKRKG